MTEPFVCLLDDVEIDAGRQYIEFRFRDFDGCNRAIQIDFSYVESLAALFQQAFISASLESEQGGNRHLGQQWVAVPRADIDHPVSVAVDVMTSRVVAMFLLGSPFQASYSLPADNPRSLANDILTACREVQEPKLTH